MTTPYDRLLLEEIPTGRFGGPRDPGREPIPATVAAYHRAVLEAEVDAYDRAHRGQRPPRPARHLHAVPDTTEGAQAA